MSKNRLYFFVSFLAIICIGLLFGPKEPENDSAVDHLLPELRKNLSQSSRLKIHQVSNNGTTLIKSESGWLVEERLGFPADASKINSVLRQLAEARRLEAKTQRPEHYERLGVGNSAVQVRLDDQPLVLVGVKSSGRSGRFVRLENDPQVWLQSALLPELSAQPRQWLNTALIDIDASDISLLEIMQSEQLLRASRDVQGQVVVDGIEPDQYQYPGIQDSLFTMFEQLRLVDVRPIESVDVSNAFSVNVTLRDGPRLRLQLVRLQVQTLEDRHWLVFDGVDSMSPEELSDLRSAAGLPSEYWKWAFEISRLNYDNIVNAKQALLSADVR